MEASFLDRFTLRYARGILSRDQTILIGLGEIGDALLVTITIGVEAFGMLVSVVLVVHGDDGDDGVLVVVVLRGY
jgi:hypothetical protein